MYTLMFGKDRYLGEFTVVSGDLNAKMDTIRLTDKVYFAPLSYYALDTTNKQKRNNNLGGNNGATDGNYDMI